MTAPEVLNPKMTQCNHDDGFYCGLADEHDAVEVHFFDACECGCGCIDESAS